MALSRRLLSRHLLLSTSTSLVRAPIYSVSVSLRLIDHGRTNFDFITKAFAWQEMTPTVGGTINSTFFSIYDTTVQQALSSGSNVHVIIDVVRLPPLFKTITAHDIHYVHSTTTRAGMVRSSTRVARQMTSSPVFGLN